jgi:hypothetical protein
MLLISLMDSIFPIAQGGSDEESNDKGRRCRDRKSLGVIPPCGRGGQWRGSWTLTAEGSSRGEMAVLEKGGGWGIEN